MLEPNAFKKLVAEAKAAATAEAADLAALRQEYLGRKGKLADLMGQLGELTPAARKKAGRAGNAAKRELESLFPSAEPAAPKGGDVPFDVTLPGDVPPVGHRHPVSLILEEVLDVFTSMGFSIAEGPEVEDDWHNFEALNMGPDHPARDMQDTFYVAGSANPQGIFTRLPRTHTSGVQIRTMQDQRPPVRIVSAGKVYRNETEDATHSAAFHQVEGLMIDTDVSFADLRGILTTALEQLLGEGTKLRFRPSFFPYTEPSAEVDVSSPKVKDGEWLELLGAGMVHPNVLRNVGYDPKKVQGFAFGIGIERLAMLRYGIDDLRLFFKPDIRLLEQF